MSIQGHIEALQRKHADLDQQVEQLQKSRAYCQLEIKQLKKEKLLLKEEICRLKDDNADAADTLNEAADSDSFEQDKFTSVRTLPITDFVSPEPEIGYVHDFNRTVKRA